MVKESKKLHFFRLTNLLSFSFLSMVIFVYPSWALNWQKTLGGNGHDGWSDIRMSGDGGYILAGSTKSFGAGHYDGWAVKLDQAGEIQWQKALGGSSDDRFNSVAASGEGGYILVGKTKSFGAGSFDGWAVKLDQTGEIVWQKSLGGNSSEAFTTVSKGSDEYFLVGWTRSFNADTSDGWVVKIDEEANIKWQLIIGGSRVDQFTSARATDDGGCVLSGWTRSYGQGGSDGWAVKISERGTVQWEKSFGGKKNDQFTSVEITPDGGYLLAGMNSSAGAEEYNGWAVKLDSDGNLKWETLVGGDSLDRFSSSVSLKDGGYLLAGSSKSIGSDYDGWLVNLDNNGRLVWQKGLSGEDNDYLNSILAAGDGDYLIAGASKTGESENGWILKVSGDGQTPDCKVEESELSQASPLSMVNDNPSKEVKLDEDLLDTEAVLADTKADFATLCSGTAVKIARQEKPQEDAPQKTPPATPPEAPEEKPPVDVASYKVPVISDSQTEKVLEEKTEQPVSKPAEAETDEIKKEKPETETEEVKTSAPTVETAKSASPPAAGPDEEKPTAPESKEKSVEKVEETKAEAVQPPPNEPKPEEKEIPNASVEPDSPEKAEEAKAEAVQPPPNEPKPEEKENPGVSAEPALPVPAKPVSLEKESTQVISEQIPIVPIDDSAETRKASQVRGKKVVYKTAVIPSRRKVRIKPASSARFQPQDPSQYWQAILGGKRTDRFQSIISTSDGGFALAGYTGSFGEGKYDGWVTKLDKSGAVRWQKTLGGSKGDRFYAVTQTSDGSLILAGYTQSFGQGGDDGWVAKLSVKGKILWQKTFGGSGNDRFLSAQGMADGAMVLAGYTKSFGSYKSDGWILKLDKNGHEIWQHIFQGKSSDKILSVKKSRDGGLLLAGYTKSFRKRIQAGWAAKLKADGSLLWQKTVQAPASSSFSTGLPTLDGGYLLAGKTGSWGKGKDDGWVVKLGQNGKISWQVVLGGSFSDSISEAIQSGRNGYVLIGKRDPYGRGGNDGWVAKLNSRGALLWQKSLGKSADDVLVGAVDIKGGLILAGFSESYDARKADGWVIKIDNSGNIPRCTNPKVGKLAVTLSSAVVKNKKLRMLKISAPTHESQADLSDSKAFYQKICP